jgi:hypothetical protein
VLDNAIFIWHSCAGAMEAQLHEGVTMADSNGVLAGRDVRGAESSTPQLMARLLAFVHSEASERRDILVFLVGAGWGVMCAIGMLAAWGIHP